MYNTPQAIGEAKRDTIKVVLNKVDSISDYSRGEEAAGVGNYPVTSTIQQLQIPTVIQGQGQGT